MSLLKDVFPDQAMLEKCAIAGTDEGLPLQDATALCAALQFRSALATAIIFGLMSLGNYLEHLRIGVSPIVSLALGAIVVWALMRFLYQEYVYIEPIKDKLPPTSTTSHDFVRMACPLLCFGFIGYFALIFLFRDWLNAAGAIGGMPIVDIVKLVGQLPWASLMFGLVAGDAYLRWKEARKIKMIPQASF